MAKTHDVPTGTVTGKVIVRRQGKPIAAQDVYVYVVDDVDPVGTRHPPMAIHQIHKQFVPRLVVAAAGTKVAFPNDDKIEHSVFANDPNYFDLGRDKVAEKSFVFDYEGEIDIFCDIHPDMSAKVKVMPSSRFARVAADGSYSLSVPTGARTLAVWMPDAQDVEHAVTVTADATATLDFKISAPERAQRSHTRRTGDSYPRERYVDD